MQQERIFPTFTTERLILREVQPRDIPAYQKHFNDYEIISHLASAVPWPFPEDGVKTFLEKTIFPAHGTSRWLWGIFEKQNSSELIGVVELRRSDVDNRGFWLGKQFWGKGYMTEAVEPVISFAFDTLGFDKLLFSNALGNERSRKIKEKTGAKFIGTKPFEFVNPNYNTAELWELTKEDWFRVRSTKAIKRKATRAILLNEENEVLMMKLHNREMGWEGWITPGGGMEPGESEDQSLRRELSEELGLTEFEVGPMVFERTHQLTWDGQLIEQSEKYFVVRTKKFRPKFTLELSEIEKSALGEFKWWSVQEITSSKETFAPTEIATLITNFG